MSHWLQEFCLEYDHAKPYFLNLLDTLYKQNVLDEEALLEWCVHVCLCCLWAPWSTLPALS